MTNKVINTITQNHMISKGDIVGVGLSGGADSVALFHFLVANQEKLGISKIKGIHIHHGIRGEEADRDLEFSKKLCEKYNVECVYYYVDVPAEAETTGESIEECARRMRYDCFAQSNCTKIATAHNLNDNIETVIFNMTRGTSISGLCGIPYMREIYIRPLLDCTREEIEEYIKDNFLDYVTDSTNLCDEYTRNKIRHNVIPQLFEINPSFGKAFSNCVDSVRSANDYILQKAKEIVEEAKFEDEYDCNELKKCHIALKKQAISLILKEQGVPNITKKYIDAVSHIIEQGGKASLGGNITANSDRQILCFGEIQPVEHFEFKVENNEDVFKTPVGTVVLEYLFKEDLQNINEFDINVLIDCDKICGSLIIRNRVEGDAYQPVKRVNKKLKKLFNEKDISVFERSKMIIISDDKGIIWTELFGVAERCKIEKDTEKAIRILVLGE